MSNVKIWLIRDPFCRHSIYHNLLYCLYQAPDEYHHTFQVAKYKKMYYLWLRRARNRMKDVWVMSSFFIIVPVKHQKYVHDKRFIR